MVGMNSVNQDMKFRKYYLFAMIKRIWHKQGNKFENRLIIYFHGYLQGKICHNSLTERFTTVNLGNIFISVTRFYPPFSS